MNRTLKRTLKISGITLGSILFLVIIAVSLVCWIVFTPGKLTKVATRLVDDYAPCKVEFEKVDLTLVKSYPFLAFRLNGLVVYDEMEDSPSDTLAAIDKLAVTVDFKTLYEEQKIIVTNLFINGVCANLYTASDGRTNLDFIQSDDEPVEETPQPADTVSSEDMNLYLDLQEISLKDLSASYIDCKAGIEAGLSDLDVDLKGLLKYDSLEARISIDIASIRASIQNDSTDISADLKGISLGGDCNKYGNDVMMKANIGLKGTSAHMDDLTASLSDLSLSLSQASCSMRSDGFEDLKASFALKGSSIKAYTDSMSATIDAISATVGKAVMMKDSLTAGAVAFRVDGISFETGADSTAMSVSVGNVALNLDAGLKTDASRITAVTALDIENLILAMAGSSPIDVNTDKLSLNLKAGIDENGISVDPKLSTPALYVTMGGERYVPGWPMSIYVPVQTNKDISKVKVLNGSNLTVNGERIGFNANASISPDMDVKGNVGVKTGDMNIDKLVSMIPESMRSMLDGIGVHGYVGLDVKAQGGYVKGQPQLGSASAKIRLDNLDANLNDSVLATSGHITANVSYPSQKAMNTGRETADLSLELSDLLFTLVDSASINATLDRISLDASVIGLTDTITEMSAEASLGIGYLEGSMDTLSATVENLDLYLQAVPSEGITAMMANIEYSSLSATMGSLLKAAVGNTSVKAMARYDEREQDLLLQWDPRVKVDLNDARLDMFEKPVVLPQLDMDFSLGQFNINDCRLELGNSNLMFWGDVYNIGAFVNKTGLLTGELFLESDYADVTELLSLISADDETANAALEETITDVEAGQDTIKVEPFIVPKGIDLTLYTNLASMSFNDHLFKNVGGDVTIKDGVAVLQELGFSSDAAQMQLTAIYNTPSPQDDPFIEIDFHLLDIEIDELISLIPSVDSIVPMLKSFSGQANFHLAAETFLEDNMPIMSTLLGAAAIEGQNLVVLDNEVFDGIKRKLLMSRKAQNRIDSLDVELQVIRNKVTLYPFRIHMDRYTAIIDGRHNINKDLDCSYTISLVDSPLPFRLGVKVSGSLNDIASHPIKHIRVVRPKYAKLYNPQKQSHTDEVVMGLKDHILNTLKGNVRESSDK